MRRLAILLLGLSVSCGRPITAPKNNTARCYYEIWRWQDPDTRIIYILHTTLPADDPRCDD